MNTSLRIAIVIALAVAVGAVVTIKNGKKEKPAHSETASATAASGSCCSPTFAPPNFGATNPVAVPSPEKAKLPLLVDLGATQCIPCKMMAPILEELKKEYAGKFAVEFIDVRENPGAGEAYRIEMIPTQLFFDAAGKELFRHTGFFGKEDILGKWKELGVDLSGKSDAGATTSTK